eukprot:TRINITY_DN8871_c0_g1_i1.p1 TRINITY_DN8871_c0_g1~~TRINITY_DN8871_c0_g1_i1.p1  ORF type:complete len:860 (+),score=172.89 TRINITY_DN8871_c0_g1_i1:30-2609(+)
MEEGHESSSPSGSYTEDSYSESSFDSNEDEPKLKYVRIGASVQENIFKYNHTATCMAVHAKFLALGTDWGYISILDFNGNEIRRFEAHSAPVKEISIDVKGEYVASCSDDGKVIITPLLNDEEKPRIHSFSRPMTAIAIDPNYSKKSSKQRVVCGGKSGQLILVSKGFWFGSSQDIIHSGEGHIHAISWRGSLLAWANDIGIKIYDFDTEERITFIKRPKGSPRPDLYRCYLCWESDTQLIIGWGDSVTIAVVKYRENPNPKLPSRQVQITSQFFTQDYFIAGIAPFAHPDSETSQIRNDLVILAYYDPNDPEHQDDDHFPELHIVSRNRQYISSEALMINNHRSYQANDYRLDHLASESLFYIVSPGDIVMAKPRDIDDRISWLLQRDRYDLALEEAELHEKEIVKHRLSEIGQKYLAYLLGNHKPIAAAKLCSRIIKEDKDLWETWVFTFAKHNYLIAIGPYIPTENPRLSPTIYEVVLSQYLEKDPVKFYDLICTWPSDIYTLNIMISAVNIKMSRMDKVPRELILSLAKLYTYSGEFDKALLIYIDLGDEGVLELIREHQLYDSIKHKVLELMEFNPEEATQLLIQNTHRISVDDVCEQLKSHPELKLTYLHNLFYSTKERNQAARNYHDDQLLLYANYNVERLYDFLQSGHYSLEFALNICTERNLYKEMVFIYWRMGHKEEALKLMIEKLGDVSQAIEFVEKQNEAWLWTDLINNSIMNPVFVSGLLENVGTHINPLDLINKIPEGMEIIGLRDRLVKIINDYMLETSLSEGCKEILKEDCTALSNRLYTSSRKATRVEIKTTRCLICRGVLVGDFKKTMGITSYFCGHSYHTQCLKQQESRLCPFCHQDDRR